MCTSAYVDLRVHSHRVLYYSSHLALNVGGCRHRVRWRIIPSDMRCDYTLCSVLGGIAFGWRVLAVQCSTENVMEHRQAHLIAVRDVTLLMHIVHSLSMDEARCLQAYNIAKLLYCLLVGGWDLREG